MQCPSFSTSYRLINFIKINKKKEDYLIIDIQFVACNGWKQTGGCDPKGAREPNNDKSCDGIIDSGASGYCDCGLDRVEKTCRDQMPYETCHDLCFHWHGNINKEIISITKTSFEIT